MTKQENLEALSQAEGYFFDRKHSEAEALLNKILRSEADHARANELLAYILDTRGERDLAISHLMRACSSSDASFAALYALGGYFLESEKYLDAAEYLKLSLKKRGKFFECLHDLGLAYIGLKQFKEATNYLLDALHLNPTSFEALNNLGAALRNLGKFSDSLQYLDAAIKINPLDPRVLLNKGVTFDAMGQFEEAVHCYEQALAINPCYLEAICNMANSLKSMGRYSEADSFYQKALTIDPKDADSHYNHSYLCLLSGDYDLGWKKYEYRWSSVDAPPYFFSSIPRLESLDGLAEKRVLVWAEQGLGDTIQFCRYIPL